MKKNLACHIISCILFTLSFISCSEKKAIPAYSDKWLLVNSSCNIGEGDEITINPKFSSEELLSLDYHWTTSDSGIVSIIEDNNSSIVVRGEKAGEAIIKVECPGETKRLSCSIVISVEKKPLRILAIGNSFSQDAVEQYLWNLFDAAGEEVIIGNLYIGGCPLEKHWSNALSGKAAYEYRKVEGGNKTNKKNVSLSAALADEKWDIVSLQQASDYSGMYDTYIPYLDNMIGYVKERVTNRKLKIAFHQTWAYAENSTHQAFLNYDKSQMKMYNCIVSALRNVKEKHDVDIIIPCGTTIQNGRTSSIGDKFNRDGYHLEVTYGRYAASCTWYESISGKSVLENSYFPSSVDKFKGEIVRKSAHEACLNPYQITQITE